jgi:glutamine cyclotransferase
MVPVMIGPMILLAAIVSPQPEPMKVAFQPVSSATARASVSIRIISGASFGADHTATTQGASRRASQLTDAAGQRQSAELLEFQ